MSDTMKEQDEVKKYIVMNKINDIFVDATGKLHYNKNLDHFQFSYRFGLMGLEMKKNNDKIKELDTNDKKFVQDSLAILMNYADFCEKQIND